MRRILKFLARLYPFDWRNRYGAEYDALLEDASPHTKDTFDVLWGAAKMQITNRSFVRIVLPCAIAGALIAATISVALPPRYSSQTIITIMAIDQSASRVVDEQRKLFNRELDHFS